MVKTTAMAVISALLYQAVPIQRTRLTVECPSGRWEYADDGTTVTLRCVPGPGPSASPTAPPSTPPSAPPTQPPPTTLPPAEDLVPCAGFPSERCPREGTCAASWNVPPSSIGIGAEPSFNRRAQNTRFGVSLTSKSEPPLCGHRGNKGTCDQWIPCGVAQDKAGYPPVSWYAAYPGFGCNMGSRDDDDCQVEHASRLCDAEEKADDASKGLNPADCRRPNGWSLVDLVGQGGGEPGVRTICALPPSIPSRVARGLERARGFRYSDWKRTPSGGFKRKGARRTIGRDAVEIAPGRMVAAAGTAPNCRSWVFDRNGFQPR